jgi:hypothetical protein
MIEIPDDLWKETNCAIARQLGVTPQAVLYARRKKLNRCLRCGRKTAPGIQHCKRHRKLVNQSKRAQRGHKPWRPGGKGRPPIQLKEAA